MNNVLRARSIDFGKFPCVVATCMRTLKAAMNYPYLASAGVEALEDLSYLVYATGGTCPLVLLNNLKKDLISCASRVGCSRAAKWPPLGIFDQRRTS